MRGIPPEQQRLTIQIVPEGHKTLAEVGAIFSPKDHLGFDKAVEFAVEDIK